MTAIDRLTYFAAALREHVEAGLDMVVHTEDCATHAADLRTALDRIKALEGDAARFQALMRCGRIKMQGSSGVDPHTGERNGNNVHFGAEFWPEPIEPEWEETYRTGTTWGRACLRALADAILEQEARAALTPPPERQG